VIYQVFVDRFYPGRGRDWAQTDDLRGFCGGTLWGVAEKLDYIADLGVTCIWLSPIFPSPSHHGYDATDLYHVEPRLGGDEALRTLVSEAHRRDIRVLLDYVCNHVSQYHPVFVEAQADPTSPYRDWFTFDDSERGYRA
jgi:glycosidase